MLTVNTVRLSNIESKPEEIVLVGLAGQRRFKGWTLFSHIDRDFEEGVYLTARGRIAYWHCVPGAQAESFEGYEGLDEFFDQRRFEETDSWPMRDAILAEYAKLTHEPYVQELDI